MRDSYHNPQLRSLKNYSYNPKYCTEEKGRQEIKDEMFLFVMLVTGNQVGFLTQKTSYRKYTFRFLEG